MMSTQGVFGNAHIRTCACSFIIYEYSEFQATCNMQSKKYPKLISIYK